ncbi:MAG: (2Fe-2S)-binding protein [Candidatus Bathyarchaeia archaeon]
MFSSSHDDSNITFTAEDNKKYRIEVKVNGKKYVLYVEPFLTLQELLRDMLGITSVKDMCTGEGACGSCTVIMDGRPILSCLTLAVDCDGKEIETAEGIAEKGHPLIDAYAKYDCAQCGYCTPGFICTAKVLLDRNRNPTEEEIKEALAGNLCRCGTYPAHIKAIMEVAARMGG